MLIFNSWYTAGRSNIYAAEDDGSNFRCLTNRYKLQRYQRLRLSPDHGHLLFYAVPDGEETGRFFFQDFDSDRLTVYKQEPYPFDMRWLTNDRLLCIKKEKLWIADLAKSTLTDLDFGGSCLVIDTAPDGNRLLLKKEPGAAGSIHVGYIDQQQAREIIRGEDYEKSHAIRYASAWSPDGEAIACVGGYGDEVWLVNADGSDPRKFATSDYFWREIRWSPDGRKIAFTRTLDDGGPSAEQAGVFVKDLSSEEERQVLTLGRSDHWRWAADSQSIVHSQVSAAGCLLLRTNIQTGRATELIGREAGLQDIDELVVM
jgi:Tol biopolymer transport system component